jgi:hypothetical protein
LYALNVAAVVTADARMGGAPGVTRAASPAEEERREAKKTRPIC